MQGFNTYNEQEIAKKMMETTIPKEHKALGRKAKGFDGKKWNERRDYLCYISSDCGDLRADCCR